MKKKLGEILVEQGAVRREDVDAALERQSGGDPARIGDLLLSEGKLTPLQLAQALCAQSGLPFVQLDQVSPMVAALVPIALQREHCLVPFKEDGPKRAIHVAVADPTTYDVLSELEFQVGRSLKISIAARDEIEAVHAALQGDLIEGAIIDDEQPTAPVAQAPQALGRLALKRVAVSSDGVMVDAPSPSPVVASAIAPSTPSRFPRPTAPPSSAAQLDVELPGPAAEPPPVSARPTAPTSQPLPPRAARPARAGSAPPPVLKPVDLPAPAPTSPQRPKSKTHPALKRPELPASPSVSSDDWSIRPVGAAIPKGGARPPEPLAPPVLDPFASLPTEQVGGPREYVPAPALPPLSALDADLEVSDALRAAEAAVRGPALATRVEPAPPVSSLAIAPTPLALSPPRRKARATAYEAPAGVAPPLASPRPDAELSGVQVKPEPSPVPSGRQKPVATQLEFNPPQPPGAAPSRSPVGTVPAFGRFSNPVVTRTGDQPTDPEANAALNTAPIDGKLLAALLPVIAGGEGEVTNPRGQPLPTQLEHPPFSAPDSTDVKAPLTAEPEGEPFTPVEHTHPRAMLPRDLETPRSQIDVTRPRAPLPSELARAFAEPEPKPPRGQALPTQHEHPPFSPGPLGAFDGLQTEEAALRDFAAEPAGLQRTESLEFIPPAETAPRPRHGETRVERPRLSRLHGTPGGEPVTEAVDHLPLEELLADKDLASGAVVAPASLSPPASDSLPAAPVVPGPEPVLTAAPLEAAADAAGTAEAASAEPPVDLAVSGPPEVALPEWMREAAAEAALDPLVAAVSDAGATVALVRLLRLLVRRGLISEAELLEELKRQ
ncbi:MAG: hypothetical protein IPJ65_06955 [Archangiaceae bacterium]|nr:hypothetical protein [Archangiaceae bacterium]